MTDFHFIRPAVLLLIPVSVWLWLLWRKQSDPLRGWRQQIDRELLAALTVGQSGTGTVPQWLLLAMWITAVVAAAGPTWELEPSPFADDVAPLMIVLKADVSMDTPDPQPSRMERATLKIADIAAAREGLPLGLIAYAGSAHLVLPPTRDTQIVGQMAAEVSPDIMPVPGDRLDMALQKAQQIISDGGQGGSILIVADTIETADSDLAAARQTVRAPLQILSVNSPDSDQRQNVEAIASTLNATVQPLQVDDSDVATIISQAASAPVAREGREGSRWQESGYWLVPVVALLLLTTFRREERGDS
ncbi:MAG: VWA domain-containing protein [Planctomycetaceae bacterium]|nr:VWA domain-containing protein [Planctomycetaceae bacterium]